MRDAGTGGPDITLLSVDDEPALPGFTRRFLERSGDCSVTTARNAPAAIQLLSQQRSDAIVSDYQMPDMDGISFLRHLRENGDTTPFIIFTGRGSPVLKAEYTRRGGITGPSIRLPWLRNNPLQTLTARWPATPGEEGAEQGANTLFLHHHFFIRAEHRGILWQPLA